MTRNHAAGFTLLEVLVASTVAVTMLSLLTAAWIGMRRTIERSQAIGNLHAQAATIATSFGQEVESIHPCGKIDLRVVRADPSDPASGRISITWMQVLDGTDTVMGQGPKHATDVAWTRWEWRADGLGGRPTLYHAVSPPWWNLGGNYYCKDSNGLDSQDYRVTQCFPVPRRDRRRWLDDNAGWLTPYTSYAAIDADGWGEGAMGGNNTPPMPVFGATGYPNLQRIQGGDGFMLDQCKQVVNSSVEDVEISWIDASGNTVRANKAGITWPSDLAPSTSPAFPTVSGKAPCIDSRQEAEYWIYQNQQVDIDQEGANGDASFHYQAKACDRYSVDGLFLDGRDTVLTGPTSTAPADNNRTILQRRPGLIRIAFTISSDPRTAVQRAAEPATAKLWPRQTFAFAFPTGTLPPPAP